jgi:curli biogenesis system outer membrane secretion channel CsgG
LKLPTKRLQAALRIALLLATAGCGATATVVGSGGPTIREAQSVPVHGVKPRIAVMAFDNKTRYDVGQGMRTMLTSTLFRTNRFIVVEREELQDVLLEQRLGATGVVRADTAPSMGVVEGAEILVFGTVTEFEPGQQGITTMVGSAQRSHVAIDLRLVDATTSRVLSATTVVGKTTDVNLTTEMLTYVGMSPMLSLQAWNNTPIESAIRLCIDRAVAHIVGKLAPPSG